MMTDLLEGDTAVDFVYLYREIVLDALHLKSIGDVLVTLSIVIAAGVL